MEKKREERRLAAILVGDMVGYSRLMEADESDTIARQKAHHDELIKHKITDHRGRIVRTTGDGLLVEFASAVDAVRCAAELQRAMAEREAEVPKDRRIQYRVGINLGDIVIDGNDIQGDGVNIAARLEALAEPGGVCVSGKVFEEVKNKVKVGFEDLGERKVKNISEPIQIYKLLLDPDAAGGLTFAVPAPALELPDKPSIAVLPFENRSGDPTQDYFAAGIAEDIITELSKFHWFFVIARNSSFKYRGPSVDLKRVAEELGVRYILEGSVREAGKHVRVSAQLIDATTGYHVWAERYDRELKDVFALQDEITENVAASVGPEFLAAETRRAVRKDIQSLDAWDLTMRGCWHIARFTKSGNAEGRRFLQEALKLDQRNGRAYSELALTYVFDAGYGWSESPAESMKGAAEAAQKAIALDRGDAWANMVLGSVLLFSKRHEDAIALLERATTLNPNMAYGHGTLGMALAYSGETAAAIESIRKALRLSPLDPFKPFWTISFAIAMFTEGRYDEAIETAKSALRESSHVVSIHRQLAAYYGLTGRLAEARAALAQVLRRAPGMNLGLVRRQLPFKDPNVMERFLDGLRKAGMPE